ncbi:MAG: hypothetical protein ACLPHI_20180 [Terriglobales bacterium]
MLPDALDTLRQVNQNLRAALLNLRPERKHCSAIKPQDFSDILSQLLRAAETLRCPPADTEAAAALRKETHEYRRILEKLKCFLPDLQGRLLAEKSRLQAVRSQVAATAAWADARKNF